MWKGQHAGEKMEKRIQDVSLVVELQQNMMCICKVQEADRNLIYLKNILIWTSYPRDQGFQISISPLVSQANNCSCDRLDSCWMTYNSSFPFSSSQSLSILLTVLFYDYDMFFSAIVMMPSLTKTSLKVNIVKL